MVGRSIHQLERGQRDASLPRRYLDETIRYLAELRRERRCLQTASSDDPSEVTPVATLRSTPSSGFAFIEGEESDVRKAAFLKEIRQGRYPNHYSSVLLSQGVIFWSAGEFCSSSALVCCG